MNLAALKHLNPEQVEVDICLVQLSLMDDVELDEMWVICWQANPRWLWHAIDHQLESFSYVFGQRKDVFQLKACLSE